MQQYPEALVHSYRLWIAVVGLHRCHRDRVGLVPRYGNVLGAIMPPYPTCALSDCHRAIARDVADESCPSQGNVTECHLAQPNDPLAE